MPDEVFEFLSRQGVLLAPQAADLLRSTRDPVSVVRRALAGLPEKPFILTLDDVLRARAIAEAAARAMPREPVPAPPQPPRPTPSPPSFGPLARAVDVAADVDLLRDGAVRTGCRGKADDFAVHFRHRLGVLRGLLLARREMVGATDIARAKKRTTEAKFVGMVRDVRPTKAGHRLIELEDEQDEVKVLVPADTPAAADLVVVDEVVGIVGTQGKDGMVIASQLVKPDVLPGHRFPTGEVPVCAAFVSDLHVGSKTFLADAWGKFASWLGNGDELAASVKYLIACGDLVDGIGVYPRQHRDLELDDIGAQYAALARCLDLIPDRVEVFLIPGNHDAVRQAEPQPALPRAVTEAFTRPAHFLGNPALFSLHGVRILAYHGRSIDDFVGLAPNLDYAHPLEAMRHMLRMRHLAPIYGGKTPIAPEAQDGLAVDVVPHIFATGHVHAAAAEVYKGVRLVNASTWQSQTAYQKMRAIEPQPARVPIVNLATGDWTVKAFA